MSVPHYKTHDAYLASFLLSQGGFLARCQRLGPKKVEYRFIADRSLHRLVRLYRRKVLIPVVPARLFGTLRRLKSRSVARW